MKRPRLTKIIMTLVLTVLIWIWADLSLEDIITLSNAIEVGIGNITDPSVWACLLGPDDRLTDLIVLESAVLTGPSAKIQRIRPQLEQGTLDLKVFIPEGLIHTDRPGYQTIPLLDLLRSHSRIRQFGLSVQECRPATAVVRIGKLEKRPVKIICLDPNNMSVDGVSIEPERLDMYVPVDRTADTLEARVTLTSQQIAELRAGPIQKRPFVILPDGQQRYADQQVIVKAAGPTDRLRPYTITNLRVGILTSQTILDRYQLEIKNPQDLYSHIEIRATDQARRAFEDERVTRYQVILQIDTETTAMQEKELIINLPRAFVRTNQIESARPPARIQFRLIPKATAEPGTAP